MKMARGVVWVCGLWAACVAGCSDDAAQPSDPWSLGDPRADMARQDQGVEEMAQPLDLSVSPDMVGPDMEPGRCVACSFDVQATGRLDDLDQGSVSGNGPFVGSDHFVWRAPVIGPDGTNRGEAINAQRPGEAPRRLVYEPGTQLTLLDVQGTNLLYWAQRGDVAQLIARFGERQVVMAEVNGPILAELGGFDGASSHMITAERAAFVVVRSGARPAQTLVFAGPDGRVGRYELPPGAFSAPFVRGRDVVLAGAIEGDPNAQTILWVRDIGQIPRKVGSRPGASQSSPVIVGQDVLWIRDGAVIRGDLEATREEVVLAGPCGPLDADAIHAVVACGPDFTGGAGSLPTGATELYMIDPGAAPQRIHQAEPGRQIVAPRVSVDRVAWLEYPVDQTFCSTPLDALGAVMVMAWDVAGARVKAGPQALGPKIAAPCFCCGAYWPPLTLSFVGALLTWRYDVDATASRESLGLGWARLGETQCRDVACE